MKAQPNIRHLIFFKMLCDEQHYRRAAQKLGITQPALTAAVKELETQFGGPLVDRSVKRAVVTTMAGNRLYRGAIDLIDRYNAICDEVAREINPQSWTVRMGVIPSIAPFLLPTLLPTLKKELPHAEIRVVESTSARLRDMLESGEIDYALMAFPFSMPGCHQEILASERFVCAVPAHADPFEPMQQIQPIDLEGQRLLLLDDGHCLRAHALEACALKDTQESKELQASSLTTLINMVAKGHGITLLPLMATQHGSLPANIKLKEFYDPEPKRTVGAAWRTQTNRAADYMDFTEAIRRAMKIVAKTRTDSL